MTTTDLSVVADPASPHIALLYIQRVVLRNALARAAARAATHTASAPDKEARGRG